MQIRKDISKYVFCPEFTLAYLNLESKKFIV